jgi:hypothetical protein
MTENAASRFEDFRGKMREFFCAVSDMAIENDIYFDMLVERCSINPDSLRKMVKAAQASPQKQEEIRQRFAEMWKVIEGASVDSLVEEERDKLPLPKKPS